MVEMTHWERMQAALAGKDVDRLPVSMWRHFFDKETSAVSLAEAMLVFQQRCEWDFMKVNPRASYHVEDWGVKTSYSGDAQPRVLETPVKQPEDWQKLKVLDVNKGVLKEHLVALELIADGLKGKVPFVMTIFTPMAIASRLVASDDIFLQHLRQHPEKVQSGLNVITETFTRFAKACLARGASGIYYATTSWATIDRLSEEEYASLARPYDLKLLNALPTAELNVLHVCREHNLLHLVNDYPVQAFSWDPRGLGNPSLVEGKALVGGKLVMGGIAHDRSLVDASPLQLAAEIIGMRLALGDRGWLLAPGCTFPPETPEAHLQAIRDAVG